MSHEEPDVDDGLGTYHRYDMHTRADGEIHGWVETNDDNDDGYPDGNIERWQEHCKTRAEFDRRVGRSRIGISGVKVTVVLDGEELT
jgi:hypothetical protein